MTEELLIRQLAGRHAASIRNPSDAQINRFIADNPRMFQQRTSLALDQIQFDPPPTVRVLQQLTDDHSLDEIAATLTRLGIRFTRNTAKPPTINPTTAAINNSISFSSQRRGFPRH